MVLWDDRDRDKERHRIEKEKRNLNRKAQEMILSASHSTFVGEQEEELKCLSE